MRSNVGYYAETINSVVKETEETGEKMNPNYEKIRQAIDEDKLADLSSEVLAETIALFKEGTSAYKILLERLTKLRAPAKAMGLHKKLEKAYKDYIAGCEEMILSIDPEKGVDKESFDLSEKKQDEASDTIMFSIEKISNILLKK